MNDMDDSVTRLQVEALGLGLVRVRCADETLVGASTVEISSGTLTMHVGQPDLPPTGIVVCGLPDTAPGVADLYGASAAQAVAELADADSGQLEVLLEPDDQDLADDAAQFGVLRWLRARSPLPLDTRLLDLEESLLAVKLAGRFDIEDALERLTATCEEVLSLMQSRTQVFRPVVDLLSESLEEIAQRAPAYSDRGEWALGQLASLDEWVVGEDLGARTVTDLPQLRPALALAASDGVYAGAATVDWGAVPRGWVSYAEDNAMWHVELDGDMARVTVAVDGPARIKWFGGEPASAGPTESDRFGFQLFVGDWPLPLLFGAMRFDRDRNTWLGRAEEGGVTATRLSAAIADGQHLRLRFRHDESQRGPGRAVAQATRWESRGITALRLLTAVEDSALRDAAVGALETAGESWSEAGCVPEADECHRLAPLARQHAWGAGLRLSVAEQWFLSAQS